MSPDGFGKPPPEEKLLKLIRGKSARPVLEAAALRSPGQFMTASTQAARAMVSRPPLRGLAWPTAALAVLAAALAIEAVVLVVQAVRPLTPVGLPVQAAPELPPAPPLVPDLPPLSGSASHTVFSPPAAAAAAPVGPVSASAKALTSRLTLMGIVAGEKPQAIIEDSETKKTFFVTAGQMVVEGAVVDKVLENSVVLDVGGLKIELSL